jgi:hypothetical protein
MLGGSDLNSFRIHSLLSTENLKSCLLPVPVPVLNPTFTIPVPVPGNPVFWHYLIRYLRQGLLILGDLDWLTVNQVQEVPVKFYFSQKLR